MTAYWNGGQVSLATGPEGLTGAAAPANLAHIVCAMCRSLRSSRSLEVRVLPSLIGYLTKAALLSATLLVALPYQALAQSGSGGGSISNDDKSLSGSREAPRSAAPSKPARRSKPEAEAPSRARKSAGGGGGGNIEGAWVLTSVGTPCGSSRDTVVISGGTLTGQYGTARVTPSGSVSGVGSAGGLSWTMSGRFSGSRGSGTFQRSDGCAGSWSGSKQ